MFAKLMGQRELFPRQEDGEEGGEDLLYDKDVKVPPGTGTQVLDWWLSFYVTLYLKGLGVLFLSFNEVFFLLFIILVFIRI